MKPKKVPTPKHCGLKEVKAKIPEPRTQSQKKKL